MTLDQKDEAVLDLLEFGDWTAIADIIRHGWRIGTVRASLKRLLDEGTIERRWHGNARFGRHVYRIAQ